MCFGAAGEQLYTNPAVERVLAELVAAPLLQAELLALTQTALHSSQPSAAELLLAHNRLMQTFVAPFTAASYITVYLVDITTCYQVERPLQHAKEVAEAASLAKKLFELAELEHSPDVGQANPGVGVVQTAVVLL